MRGWGRRVLVAAGSVLGLLLLLALLAFFLPPGHVASTEACYAAPRADVWQAIRDFRTVPSWSRDIAGMQPAGIDDGRETWTLQGDMGEALLTVAVDEAPLRLVTEIDAGIFQGAWTYELSGGEKDTCLRITERGEVRLPLLRWFVLLSDLHASARRYLRDLGTHLGQPVEPHDL